MRHLVRVEAQGKEVEQLDASGGPGALFAHVAERWRPEAFFAECGRRAVWWVIDFPTPASITEFTHLMIAKAGAYPELRPVMTGPEAAEAIPEAHRKARAPL